MTAAEIVALRPITEVWLALGGDEPKRGRARAFMRGGDNPQSISLNDAKGTWYDHRDGEGGGVLHLIQRVRGGTRADALRWLAALNGVAIDNQPRRTRAEAAAIHRIRHESAYFASAARLMAETALESLATEDPERAIYTELMVTLRTSPMVEYSIWRDNFPQLAAALVYAGRKREQRLQRMLAEFLTKGIAGDAA